MPQCFLCRKNHDEVSALFKHFFLIHGQHNFTLYHCIEDGCRRSFHLKNTFRKHLYNTHVSSENSESLIHSNTTETDAGPCIPIISTKIDNPFHPTLSESNSYTLPNFVSSLYANPLLPRNVVQDVIAGMSKYICGSLTSNLENVFSEMAVAAKQGNDISSYKDRLLSVVKSPIENLDTEFKRLKYFERQRTYIPPKEIVIGERRCNVKERGVLRSKLVTCTEQFVPLRNVLQAFFSLNNVMQETLDYMNSLKEGSLQNFIQGSFWINASKHFGNKLVFPLFLYFDDYETGNVLGSHSGIHKLGAVYVSVGCIPPDRASSLNNIFLTLLFHSQDRTAFGNNVIFAPIIEELNFLSETGVDIDVSAYKGKLYFNLGLIIGDNLGLHSITGFNETFSSNHPCRICNVTKEALKKQYFEEEHLLRNIVNYTTQLQLNCPSSTGIKEKCVWLSVKNFSLFDQLGVDIMHDILEGVAKYVMCFLILKYTQDLKYFSLKKLNDKIEHFDFGPDNSSKPCLLSAEHISKNNIRLSASEMLTIVRYFGLLVGEFVPTDDNYWTIYITLRQIIDLLMCTLLTKDRCSLLQVLVAELNELYTKFTNENLKPKFHFLVHYHAMILKFGPLVHFWSMRFEAKHRISKISARASFNRRNLTLTLATKHQLQLNDIFVKGSLNTTISVGVSKRISEQDRNYIIRHLNLDPNLSFIPVSWAKVKGTLYKYGTILVQDIGNFGDVAFMSVTNVFVYNEETVIFNCSSLTTINFDFHLHCFEVEIPNEKQNIYVTHDSLISFLPNHINVTSNGKKYITQRAQL